MTDALKQAGLRIPETLPDDWIVDCKGVGRGDQALTYLGKYLYRGVLPEGNLLRCQDGQVTFRYKTNKGQCKTRTLRGEDLLWLLMQHVLPRGFHRARDYGFLHPNSKSLLKQVQLWFSINPPAPAPEPSKDCPRCPVCGATEVIRTLLLAKPQAAPT